MDGKLTDVLIEDFYMDDPKTGMKKLVEKYINVWADSGKKDIIRTVKGVTNVFLTRGDCEYEVFLDPRYDREWVKAEIEAVIRCGEE